MKISVFHDIDNNVYRARIETSDFSQCDLRLMEDYGEPTVNIGGDFYGTRPDTVGDADLSAGHDWSTNNESFILTVNAGDPVEYTLSADCATLDAIVAAINELFEDEGLDDLVEAYASDDMYLGIRTVRYGADQALAIAAGGSSSDALATFGIDEGTESGSGSPRFVIPDSYRKLKSESPFSYGADARDEQYAGAAKVQADLWTETIVSEIKSEMDDLRANSDTFSGETMETY